jgi:hypothetical protein
MLDDDDRDAPAFDPPYVGCLYRNYFETCRRAGVEPVSRERAEGLILERGEVLSGCPEPTQH